MLLGYDSILVFGFVWEDGEDGDRSYNGETAMLSVWDETMSAVRQ